MYGKEYIEWLDDPLAGRTLHDAIFMRHAGSESALLKEIIRRYGVTVRGMGWHEERSPKTVTI